MIDIDKVRKAVKIYQLSAGRDSPQFGDIKIMMLAGIPDSFAITDEYNFAFWNEYEVLKSQFPQIPRHTEKAKLVENFKQLYRLLPDSKVPDILRLMGCKQEEIYEQVNGKHKGTALYMTCSYHMNKLKKNSNRPIITAPPPTDSIDTNLLSPVSETSELTDDLEAYAELSIPSTNSRSVSSATPPSSSNSSRSSSNSSRSKEYPSKKELPALRTTEDSKHDKSFEKFFVSKSRRKNASEAQEARQWLQRRRDVKSSAYKVATVLYQTVKENRNDLRQFKDATACATAVNEFFGFCNLVSGNQLIDAVKNKRVGLSPPRPGTRGLTPDEDMRNLADLIYTMAAIEQSNGEQRMTRSQQVTMIGSIVDDKRERDGKPKLGDTWQFYERLQTMNSLKQGTCRVNEREARRVLWMTINNAKRHYQKWEEFLVQYGFARKPLSIRERHDHGYVIFHPNQLQRLIQFDECKLSLDGSSDENAGGRPSVTHTTSAVNEAGAPANKDGDAVTLMLCAIGTEMVPPLIIYPSSAAKKEGFKVAIKNIESFHQVKGKYGLPTARWHDPIFAVSKKGGMNSEIFSDYINNHVLPLIPDCADIDGKRVVMKADMGPGRKSIDFLSRVYVSGAHFFPGMPNSTEEMQEMDQCFGAFKTALYRNRKALYEARVGQKGLTTTLSHADIGYLIFGGNVRLPIVPGDRPRTILLENAFETYLSQDHIRRAWEKCGYYPATRAPMRSEKMRYEIVEAGMDIDPNCDLDLTEQATISLLEWLEEMNHKAVEKLLENGYSKAPQGRRFVKRITEEQVEAREAMQTQPNTRERQDLLAKCKYAGDFFKVDGGPMTTADYLIAQERLLMTDRGKKMRSQKKVYESAAKNKELYDKLLESNKTKWTKKETLIAIRRYHSINSIPADEKGLVTKSAQEVQRVFNSKYKGKDAPPIPLWTPELESKLGRLERGEIDSVQETAIYARAVKRNEDFIVMRLQAVSEYTRNNAMRRLYESLDEESRTKLIQSLQGIPTVAFEYEESDEDEDYEAEELSDISLEEDSSVEEAVLEEGDGDHCSINTERSSSSETASVQESPPRYSLREKATKRNKADSLEANEEKRNDLLAKKAESVLQGEHESALEAARIDLEAAYSRISEGKKPQVKHLVALLLSKGAKIPSKKAKPVLEQLWDEVRKDEDWKRTVNFTKSDEEELNSLEK